VTDIYDYIRGVVHLIAAQLDSVIDSQQDVIDHFIEENLKTEDTKQLAYLKTLLILRVVIGTFLGIIVLTIFLVLIGLLLRYLRNCCCKKRRNSYDVYDLVPTYKNAETIAQANRVLCYSCVSLPPPPQELITPTTTEEVKEPTHIVTFKQ